MENSKKEEMMDGIIGKFGFEDIHTIIFCGMVENNCSDDSLCETYDNYMDL